MKDTLFDREPERMIDVGHSRVPYWRSGSGPDLFFVHGWPLHSATWRHLEPLLAPHFTCHFIDLPGTGQSEWGRDSKIGLVAHADTVEKVIETIGLDRYGLVAFDSGAAIAREVAARHGDRVRGLVTGNTEIPGHTPLMVKLMVVLGKLPLGGALMLPMLRWRWLRRSRLGFKGCFADLDRSLDGDFTERFIEPLVASRRAYAGQMLLVAGLHDGLLARLEAIHGQMTAPALLVWGTDDPWFPLERARGMVEQFAGGAELVEIDGGKLFVHEEFAPAFADHAIGFLRGRFGASEAA